METKQNCAFRLIYTCSPVDVENGIHIGSYRYYLGTKLGDQLRAQLPDNLDFVVPVPNSGLYYAMGLSHAAGIPYLQALVKPCGSKRTLPESDLVKRGQMIEQSITLLPNLIQGKRVVLVDEAIFTGTTLRLVCGKLRRCGAAGIYICIPTSPCVSPCPLLPQKSLLAQRLSPEEMRRFFQADGLWFLDSDTFRSNTAQFGPVCTRCFQ